MEYRGIQVTGKWYALFSQTGQEIRELSDRVGRFPDEVLTTNTGRTRVDCTMRAPHETIESYLFDVVGRGDLVTLHGYTHILREGIAHKRRIGAIIWNGHPGLAPIYPELAGRDPQEKFFQLQAERQYPIIGSIVHEVTRYVDKGPLVSVVTKNVPEPLRGRVPRETVYEILRMTSMDAWLKALKGVL